MSGKMESLSKSIQMTSFEAWGHFDTQRDGTAYVRISPAEISINQATIWLESIYRIGIFLNRSALPYEHLDPTVLG